jgi:hypothetical protein
MDAYTWLPDWSAGYDAADITEADERAACERAEAWLDAHQPEGLTITVRPPNHGELAGTYVRTPTGLRVLGCWNEEVPADVRDLTDRAWEHAITTWPDAAEEVI